MNGPELTSGCRWYVVRTQPHREDRAERELQNQGFRVFLPKRLKTIRHSRRVSTRAAAYFPRYLFVEADLAAQQWRRIRSTYGVSELLTNGDTPTPVPTGIVETLMASLDKEGLVSIDSRLIVGSQVRISAGPFQSLVATLDKLHDAERVRVLLDLMGGKVAVTINSQFLETLD